MLLPNAIKLIAVSALLTGAASTFSAQSHCSATSGPTITPVVELYTSEGCSSCPPADKWASSLKGKDLVVQAFHVGYWDYIGWVDRFAAPAHTSRQREIAVRNKQSNVYTPQAVLDGKDWSAWAQWSGQAARRPAGASVTVRQLAANQFEASVGAAATPQSVSGWSAYWTITEHGHSSRVQAGENAGELLKHDFVVRQYSAAGDYKASDMPQRLAFRSIAATPGHARQVNLVVFDTKTGSTLQAVSLRCAV